MYNYPLHFKIFGKGKSFVLFLHGWGGSTNSFLSVAKRLSETHKVILIDFYGFGKSKFPDNALDTYEYAVQLYLFLKKKNMDNLNIVAHSFGGRVAIILASLFDIKVNKLVLVNSAGVLPRRSIKYKCKVLKYKIYKKLSNLKLISDDRLSKFGSEEYKQLNTLQKFSYVKIVNQGLEYLMKNVKNNTLIVWGSEDKTTPLYMAYTIKKLIPNSSTYIYENSGHFSYLENHLNFCNLLLTYLKDN